MQREMLKTARKNHTLTQNEVAKYIGVKQSWYSKIEDGSADLNLEQSKLLIKLLKININML